MQTINRFHYDEKIQQYCFEKIRPVGHAALSAERQMVVDGSITAF